ncbi:MAG TPA: hypothetical protein VL651_03035 [Bacteroidia bacterium]|jgi:hypothetical protein|nr:hypothetical protein [Bacteroidia bacterium]
MKRISLLLFLFLAFTSFSSAKKPLWLSGVWEGTGTQPSANNETWTILATLDPVNNVYKIEYPSLNCGGSWSLVKAGKDKAEFKEQITKGMNLCTLTGKVILTKTDDDHLEYAYYNVGAKTKDSYGTLTRRK